MNISNDRDGWCLIARNNPKCRLTCATMSSLPSNAMREALDLLLDKLKSSLSRACHTHENIQCYTWSMVLYCSCRPDIASSKYPMSLCEVCQHLQLFQSSHPKDSPFMMKDVLMMFAMRNCLSTLFCPTNRRQASNAKPAVGNGVLPARFLMISFLITEGSGHVTPKQIKDSLYSSGRDVWV